MKKTEVLYEIAQKLGYEGGQPATVSDAIEAITVALGGSAGDDDTISGELNDLCTVVTSGGGGVTLGNPFVMCVYTDDEGPLIVGYACEALNLSVYSTSTVRLPSANTYVLTEFGDPSDNNEPIYFLEAGISAFISYDGGNTAEAFTGWQFAT